MTSSRWDKERGGGGGLKNGQIQTEVDEYSRGRGRGSAEIRCPEL